MICQQLKKWSHQMKQKLGIWKQPQKLAISTKPMPFSKLFAEDRRLFLGAQGIHYSQEVLVFSCLWPIIECCLYQVL